VPRRNLGYRVCCSHPTATRSALGILVVRKRLATQILLCLWLPLQSLTHHMGNWVILTCIMSTIPHKHVHRINFENFCTLKVIRCRHLRFTKLSKGVSKIILKFPHKVIFRTRNYGTLLLAILFLRNDLLEISVELVSCRKSRRPSSINFPPASQVEALDVEILLSSQGSRIVNMEKPSIVYSFLVRAHNLQILRIEQGSTPMIDRSFLLRFSCCYRERTALYTELFSCLSPSWSIP
jgi:hypothetical protein